ncbi:MauE/DoxX family redox-associated membrane protein [Deinococcus apachensis]|uniref:MauE/DoxX family redox-associated membrane protein n=1 Tax=Deinococcus apachensis TaxID=309886 RepID=UPI0003801874|nr:MauE/DoxX family redox-associated membrane protein [Deinococcus apachensis]
MNVLSLIALLVLFIVFAVAATAKFLDRGGARQAMLDFGMPAPLAPLFAALLPVAEGVIAVTLLFPATRHWSAVAAGVLLLTFLLAVGYQLIRGRRPTCNCFGQLHPGRISGWTLARNLALFGLAAALVWPVPQAVVTFSPSFRAAFTPAVVWLLVAVAVLLVGQVLTGRALFALMRQQGRLLVRLDALEAPRAPVPPKPAPALQAAGLPVGARAPEFNLPSLVGETLTLGTLLAPQRPLVLIFVDPDCAPCTALLPQVAAWEQQGGVSFALISRGSVEANQKKVGPHHLATVLRQAEREVSERYRVQATPSAVLVHPDGTVAAPAAAGAVDIARLVESAFASVMSAAPQEASRQMPVPLAVGAAVPQLRLKDLQGRDFSEVHLLGQETFLLFFDPRCGYCRNMLEALKAWEVRRRADAPRLVLISAGSLQENVALELRSTVVLDEISSAMNRFGVPGTPSAVRISAFGRVASPVAVGADEVFALMAPLEPAVQRVGTLSTA